MAQSSQPLSNWKSQFVDNHRLSTITDLKRDTIYTIRVEAYTAIGSGPPSPPVQVKTQEGVPGQPTDIRVLEQAATSLLLEWSPPGAHSLMGKHHRIRALLERHFFKEGKSDTGLHISVISHTKKD